jgi:hypothetical protein
VDHLLGAKPHTIAYQRVRSRDGPRQAGPSAPPPKSAPARVSQAEAAAISRAVKTSWPA